MSHVLKILWDSDDKTKTNGIEITKKQMQIHRFR